MTFATKVEINGVDVTDYVIEYKVVDTTNDVTPATVVLGNNVISLLNVESQQSVVISRGMTTSTDQTIFRGYVASVSEQSAYILSVECADKLWILNRISLTKTYDKNIDAQAGVISEIAKDLIETHGGLTASVVASGTANVLNKYYLLNKTVHDALRELAELIDYQVYYDPSDDKVYFVPRGYESSAVTLEVGVNVANIPTWMTDYTTIKNVVTITGDFQELESTEEFSGDGTETEFEIERVPQSVKVYVDDVLQTGGVENQTSSYDYYVDKENQKIIFTADSTPGVGVDNIEINYSYLEPIIVTQKNPVSREIYGDYTYNKYIDTIKTTEDAIMKVNEIITKFSNPSIKTSLDIVSVFTLHAGMTIQVIDSTNDRNEVVTIKRYTYKYPEVIDEADVDNYPLFNDFVESKEIRNRIDRLERKNQTAGGLINQYFSFEHFAAVKRRYFKLQRETATNDGFILNSTAKGILGTSKLGNPFAAATTQKLVQGRMTYEERCTDEDFHDGVNSTATFDTANKRIDFTSGQVWYSSAIDVGTTVLSINVTLPELTGTVKIEVSSDNKSTWTEVTAGTPTGLTSDGTGTFIRITETGSTTARIENELGDYDEILSPAIKAVMVEAIS